MTRRAKDSTATPNAPDGQGDTTEGSPAATDGTPAEEPARAAQTSHETPADAGGATKRLEASSPPDKGPDPADPLQDLQQALAAANDRFLRARADYDNLVRRTESDRGRLAQAAAARIIERIVAPLEVLQRAATELEAIDPSHAAGVRMAEQQLSQALAHEGLEPVPGIGSVFDHNHHEAVAHEASQQPAGVVVEVVRPGYRLGGKLLRAALVKVSSGPAA